MNKKLLISLLYINLKIFGVTISIYNCLVQYNFLPNYLFFLEYDNMSSNSVYTVFVQLDLFCVINLIQIYTSLLYVMNY